MNLSCSSRVIKYLIFVINLIFVITGIIILAVGVSVKAYYYPFDTFLDDKYFSLPNLLIAIGVLIFFIAFFGCCGAIKESWIMLMVFSGLLIVIFILEFSAGIAGYVLRDRTASFLDTRLRESLSEYNVNPETTKLWDIIQEQFECCGVGNYSDWHGTFGNESLPVSCCPSVWGTIGSFQCNAFTTTTTVTTPTTVSTTPNTSGQKLNRQKREDGDFPPESNNSTEATSVPTSIASSPVTSATTVATEATSSTSAPKESENVTTTTGYPESTSSPFSTGCEQAFGNFIRAHAVQIAGCAMALTVIQFIGIVFSCHLARQLKNGYYST